MITFSNPVYLFLGFDFYTDNKELKNYLFQAHKENCLDGDSFKYDSEGFEKAFPGVIAAAQAAISDLNKKRIPCNSLVYLNGVMQAWPMEGFGDPETKLPTPSKLCPNKSTYPVEL